MTGNQIIADEVAVLERLLGGGKPYEFQVFSKFTSYGYFVSVVHKATRRVWQTQIITSPDNVILEVRRDVAAKMLT